MVNPAYALHWFVIGAEFPVGRCLIANLNESGTSYSAVSLESRDFSAIRNGGQAARPVAILSCLPQELDGLEHLKFWSDVLKQYDIPVIVLSSRQSKAAQATKGIVSWHYDEQLVADIESLAQTHERHLILRLNDVFSFDKNDFSLKILAQMKEQESLVIDDNYYIYPTPVDDCADVLIAMMQQVNCDESLWGAYSYTGFEPVSLYNFSEVLLAEASQYEPLSEVKLLAERTVSNTYDEELLTSDDSKFSFGIKPKPWRLGLSRLIKKYYNNH